MVQRTHKSIYLFVALGILAILLAAIFQPLKPTNNEAPTKTLLPQQTTSTAPIKRELQIIGDTNCREKTKSAIERLRTGSPKHFTLIQNYIGVIECVDAGSGMYAWEDPPRYQVGKLTWDADTLWYAGTIAHDMCHSQEYHEYLDAHPSSTVPQDAFSGRAAEQRCLNVQVDALRNMGARRETIEYVQGTIDTKYWEIKDRTW